MPGTAVGRGLEAGPQVGILAAVISQTDNPEHDTSEADYERQLWRFLDRASARWTKINLPDDDAVRRGAFMRLVLSGQVQLRLSVLARGLPNEPRVRATVVVTGDYTKVLADHIRAAIPEFAGRVAVTPQLPVEYRLSRAGQETQNEVREFGGGELEEGFLSASLAFAMPAAVSIRDLVYEERESGDDTDLSGEASPPTDSKKTPQTAAWPLHKTEGHVSAYLDRKKHLYRRLAADILDGMPGAYGRFRKEFGPTAIAAAITEKVGPTAHRPCRKQDVEKTSAYCRRAQPLLKRPPEKPDDWEDLLESGHGKALPGILDEIPFEDDE